MRFQKMPIVRINSTNSFGSSGCLNNPFHNNDLFQFMNRLRTQKHRPKIDLPLRNNTYR